MTNLAGRACLPGYGTSRKAVEAGHKLKRGVVAEGLGNGLKLQLRPFTSYT